ADIADHVRRDVGERILAEESRLDLHTRKTVAMHGETSDFLIGQSCAERQALEVPRLLEQLAETLAIPRLHVDDFRQRLDRFVEIFDAGRHDLERVAGIALREHDAVAVGYNTAVRND